MKLLFFLLIPIFLLGQTIAEKKAQLRAIHESVCEEHTAAIENLNAELQHLRHSLHEQSKAASILHQNHKAPLEFKRLLNEINETRSRIKALEEEWQQNYVFEGESNALWHHPQTTLGDIIADYGTSYVYLMTPEVAALPMSVASHLPIPSQSWEEMIDVVLASSGVGVRQLNPYLRELFIIEEHSLGITAITDSIEDLNSLPSSSRVCFVLNPKPRDPTLVSQWLLRFATPVRSRVCLIGKNIFLIAEVKEIKELLSLYRFMDAKDSTKEYRLIPLTRMKSAEMAEILLTYFSHGLEENKTPLELSLQPLEGTREALFLAGCKDALNEAEKMIQEIERRLQDPKRKTVYCYTCKHCEAAEVANVLQRVYSMLLGEQFDLSPSPSIESENSVTSLPVSTPLVSPATVLNKVENSQNSSFIVDPKSGSILMVVESSLLPTIKDVVAKIDQPKKMVTIEVLLFEKKITEEDHFGLNLLKVGSTASGKQDTSLTWNSSNDLGILSFILSHAKNQFVPAFDLAYNFLLSQEHVQINACPSITTMNQTPAKIALVEEISLSNGVVFDGEETSRLRDSYSRAQYGITIEITPTIHEEEHFVTLLTDITFDTTKPSKESRPDVTRRNIKNQVRVPDGQTVILGGLRRKTTNDSNEAIPILSEIPGLGCFFKENKLSESQTEMFICLTPKIIDISPKGHCRQYLDELQRRPGDLPELTKALAAAKEVAFGKSLTHDLQVLCN